MQFVNRSSSNTTQRTYRTFRSQTSTPRNNSQSTTPSYAFPPATAMAHTRWRTVCTLVDHPSSHRSNSHVIEYVLHSRASDLNSKTNSSSRELELGRSGSGVSHARVKPTILQLSRVIALLKDSRQGPGKLLTIGDIPTMWTGCDVLWN
jgi:hypothetical protein